MLILLLPHAVSTWVHMCTRIHGAGGCIHTAEVHEQVEEEVEMEQSPKLEFIRLHWMLLFFSGIFFSTTLGLIKPF